MYTRRSPAGDQATRVATKGLSSGAVTIVLGPPSPGTSTIPLTPPITPPTARVRLSGDYARSPGIIVVTSDCAPVPSESTTINWKSELRWYAMSRPSGDQDGPVSDHAGVWVRLVGE